MTLAAGAAAWVLALWPGYPPQTAADTVPHDLRAMVAAAPESVTVGDPFRSYVRLEVPPGTRVTFPALAGDDSLQLVAPPRIDTLAPDTLIAIYPLVAWIAGEPLRADVGVDLELATGARLTYPVSLRLPTVVPVLPAEGEVQPRPPRGLMIPGEAVRSWWWLWILAAALALAALAWALLRRRRPTPADPREEALRQLDRLAETHAAPSTPDLYYAEITRVLRRYVAAVNAGWGEDLTTSELAVRMRISPAAGFQRGTLEDLLRRADPVKFGGEAAPADEARRFWSNVRAWIENNPADEPERREAA